jgi:methionyl-tRNA formyltransferase
VRVLLLSPYGAPIAKAIRASGDTVMLEGDNPLQWVSADFIVMYGYRKLIREPLLSQFHGRIINIHGSFLPWNRGAYPNLFSWINNTPKGATIHHVNGGVDTGNIIVRHAVDFSRAPNTTLQSSYDVIRLTAEELFREAWPVIRAKHVAGTKQDPKEGSFHTIKEALPIIEKLPKSWDTPVRDL